MHVCVFDRLYRLCLHVYGRRGTRYAFKKVSQESNVDAWASELHTPSPWHLTTKGCPQTRLGPHAYLSQA